MNIIIDGKSVTFSENDANIVDVAEKIGIMIPAPCYRSNKKDGCCKACLIEIDGLQSYACATKPEDGMNITMNRDDLNEERKGRIKKYKETPAQDCNCKCDCSTDMNKGTNCC
jgi:NADH dehydrogenase/NADH:ubiquinone oxidoreductase subunit G